MSVTKIRAKILSALGRKKEALALLGRDITAGRAAFPKQTDELKALRDELGSAK